MRLVETLLHKFYAAGISIGQDGSMLVAGTRERVLAWGMLFCMIAALSLTAYLLCRHNRFGRRLALGILTVSLWLPILVIPSVEHEYIQVSPEQLTIDTGNWLLSSRRHYPLVNLDHISELDEGLVPGNLIGDPDVTWRITWLDGRSELVPLNDFFNAHRMVVAIYIEDHGLHVVRLEERTAVSD